MSHVALASSPALPPSAWVPGVWLASISMLGCLPSRYSFDAYLGRIIGSHALSFARTMRRRRAPERHDGHWWLAAGARAGAIRAGFPRERDRPARSAGADGRRSERTWRRRYRPSPVTAESDR